MAEGVDCDLCGMVEDDDEVDSLGNWESTGENALATSKIGARGEKFNSGWQDGVYGLMGCVMFVMSVNSGSVFGLSKTCRGHLIYILDMVTLCMILWTAWQLAAAQ